MKTHTETMRRASIAIDAELLAWAKKEAHRRETTVSGLVRDLLEALRKGGNAPADDCGTVADEPWFFAPPNGNDDVERGGAEEACLAHTQEVAGSNPAHATKSKKGAARRPHGKTATKGKGGRK